ncbi:PREDICTED: uncharacterized protein LOC103602256 [Galeopterus variegatus]|uniref:Uncharacterized protein LOC103602256 n=1 Tax=Galeopterus variegatus TaxID=482537 RepID=A0ABM0RWA0_GALVR|nr:PREDICTED: uncharacterized protein LOC103602256 [Galeopterus variegatus]
MPPPPTQLQFPGGLTPRITSSPRTKPRAKTGAPTGRFQDPDSSLQQPHCPEPPPARRPAATPLAGRGRLRPRDPSHSPAVWPMEELRMAKLPRAWQSPVAPYLEDFGRLCWKEMREKDAGGLERWHLHPFQPSFFPGVAETAHPIGSKMWFAASLRVYAALFCLVTDSLEMKLMMSFLRLTNRKSSRGETFLPLRLCCFTRVSERARAEGVGEISSRVARMISEAPPPRLYIKGWRGALRRHFALEWSGL